MPSPSALTWPNSDPGILRRRDLFLKTGLLLAALSVTPPRAQALGGVVLEEGVDAPDFTLEGSSQLESDKQRWTLADFRGQWLVAYFYPRDFTGGCTIEARGFAKLLDRYRELDAAVVGISADSVDDHASFCSSEGLDFPLLSDPDGTVSKAYGSWMAPYSLRHTFLIDPDGKLQKRWVAVRPSGHAQEVLDELINQQQARAV